MQKVGGGVQPLSGEERMQTVMAFWSHIGLGVNLLKSLASYLVRVTLSIPSLQNPDVPASLREDIRC